MKSFLIVATIILLVIVGVYYFSTRSGANDQTHNWNVELTKPLDYEIEFKNISYYKAAKEIYRYTTLNSFSGWSGSAPGNVLHTKPKEYLPDSVKLSWTETSSNISYAAAFEFPKQKLLDYWNENYALQQQKWGTDYPKGPLSLKLGIAPEGMMTLWLYDLDVNTSGFAIEIESYKVTTDHSKKESQTIIHSPTAISNIRFGTPHFYPFEGENVVAMSVRYYNGELNSISLKQENGSILETINTDRGWGLAKEIIVHWFDKEGKGYKSTYKVNIEELPKNVLENPQDTHMIYLLDRPNTPDEEWNTYTNSHIFEVTESQRENMN